MVIIESGHAKESSSAAPVLWLTGLSGAGKSTLATATAARLRGQGYLVEVLDGDELRSELSPDLGFAPGDREMHNTRVMYVAGLLSRNGITVIVPMISPYRRIRETANKRLPGYCEIYVRCPLDECVRRDPKGLYRRAMSGEIRNFTGIGDPYEEPLSPAIVVDTGRDSVGKCVDAIITVFINRSVGNERKVRK